VLAGNAGQDNTKNMINPSTSCDDCGEKRR